MLFLFFIIEANNLAVLNPSDCVYESLDLSLIKDKTYIIIALIEVIINCKFHEAFFHVIGSN